MNIKEINAEIERLQALRKELAGYEPTVCGIGYLGDDYDKTTDRQVYARWNGMLQRCYNPNFTNYNSYGANGIVVADEWLNFSNFKKWFLDSYYDIGNEKLVTDKDILVKNNKIYSSETCLLVPISFNSIFAGMNEYSSKTVKYGVSGLNRQSNGKYQLKLFGTTFSNFNTVEEAKETRRNVYKALLQGLVNNYPTMPLYVKDSILNAEI